MAVRVALDQNIPVKTDTDILAFLCQGQGYIRCSLLCIYTVCLAASVAQLDVRLTGD